MIPQKRKWRKENKKAPGHRPELSIILFTTLKRFPLLDESLLFLYNNLRILKERHIG